MDACCVEWVKLDSDLTVVAGAERAWTYKGHRPIDGLFNTPMEHAGAIASTAQLLDGVIWAALEASPNADLRPSMTLNRYVWQLIGNFHTAAYTPSFCGEIAQKLRASGNTVFAEFIEEKAREESGHDLLALRDLEALGFRARELTESIYPPTSRALNEWISNRTAHGDVLSIVGYLYALERLAAALTDDHLKKVSKLLPPGVKAMRCLKIHSGSGTDARHVEEGVEFICGLEAHERTSIAKACFRATQIIYSAQDEWVQSDEELDELFAPFRHCAVASGNA